MSHIMLYLIFLEKELFDQGYYNVRKDLQHSHWAKLSNRSIQLPENGAFQNTNFCILKKQNYIKPIRHEISEKRSRLNMI